MFLVLIKSLERINIPLNRSRLHESEELQSENGKACRTMMDEKNENMTTDMKNS